MQRKGYDRETAIDLLLVSVKLAVEARDQFWAEHQGRPTSHASASTKPETRAPTQLAPFPPDARETTTATTPEAERAQQQRGGTGDEKRHGRRRPLVAASVGCYGAALADGSEYRGEYGDTVGQQDLKGWHKERLDILARADGVDLVMFETVPCLAEVRAILSLLEVRENRCYCIADACCLSPSLHSSVRVWCASWVLNRSASSTYFSLSGVLDRFLRRHVHSTIQFFPCMFATQSWPTTVGSMKPRARKKGCSRPVCICTTIPSIAGDVVVILNILS